jgi:hypothetical protein
MQLDKKTTIFFVIVFIILVSLLLIPWGNSKPQKLTVERELIVGDFVFDKPKPPPPIPSAPPPFTGVEGGIPTSDPFAGGG